jgi:hypothetical protein
MKINNPKDFVDKITKEDALNNDVIFKATKETGGRGYLPPKVKDYFISDGEEIKLTELQHKRFEELVAKERKILVDDVVTWTEYKEATEEEKIKMLGKHYDKGYDQAKIQLIQEFNLPVKESDESSRGSRGGRQSSGR